VVIQKYTRQEVGGRLYHIAPILHKGFFAYSRNPEGTPGYIMVSMTDSDDVRLVTRLEGKDLKIRIQPAGHAAWGDKLERIVYAYRPTALTGRTVFEVDEGLHPYWVVPVYKNTIGWSGAELTSLLIVDAVNGNLKEYGPDEAPPWVDRVQPVEFIEEQLSNWGELRGGYWNSWFAKTGLLQSDPGNALVYRDGGCYLFDSLTSYAGSDEATVGFVLVNLRTQAVQHVSLAGATEWAARVSALGDERVRHLRYRAGFPVPTMIEGQPTYFFSLEDPDSHIAKMFALVNIAKHQIVGTGAGIQAAKTDYLTKLRGPGQTSPYTPEARLFETTGRILRQGQYIRSGETCYSFIIDEARDRIFLAGSDFAEASVTQAGDRVHIKAIKTPGAIWSLVFFDNLEFTQAGEYESMEK
jgi:hypothetical protein